MYDSRSGSTLMASLLNRFDGIVVTLESAFVSRILELNNNMIINNSDKLISYLCEELQFCELGLDMKKLKTEFDMKNLSKKNIIEKILMNYICSHQFSNPEYLIVKHPPYENLDLVIKMFPKVKFIQILRDGRAVYNSKKKTKSLSGKMMNENIIISALDWRIKESILNKYKNISITIKFENLVKETKSTLNEILIFLKISESGKIITKEQSDYYISIGEEQKKIHNNVKNKPDIKIIEQWKTELNIKEINLFNYINKKILNKHGYFTEPINYYWAYITYVIYFIILVLQKFINVIKLLRTPYLIKLKLKRRFLFYYQN